MTLTLSDLHVENRKGNSIIGNIDASGDCWEWTGSITHNGYGRVWIDGKHEPAHRVVYEALVGQIPDGLDIDHLCRVRHCVNPDHLEPVTRQENLRRGTVNQYSRATHCIRGHPLSGTNLYLPPRGGRACRSCSNDSGRRSRSRRA